MKTIAITSELHYTADISKASTVERMEKPIFTADKNAHAFVVAVTDNGLNVDLSGASCRADFIRADGATVPLTGAVSGSMASVTLDQHCYAVQGRFRLSIKLTMGNVIHTILHVGGYVDTSSTDSMIDPGDLIPSLDELLAEIGNMQAAAAAANQATTAAETAAQSANTAAAAAQAAAQKIDGMTVSAQTLAPGAQATATVTEAGGAKVVAFGIPQGAKGDKGDPGNVNSVNGVLPDASGNVKIPVGISPNLLDNWYFVGGGTPGNFPINRQGKNLYNFDGWERGLDRWMTHGTTTINTNRITLSGHLIQPLEDSLINAISNRTCTLSILTSTGLYTDTKLVGDFTGSYHNYLDINPGDGWGCYLVSNPPNSSREVLIATDDGAAIDPIAVKLELGDTQTLAHQESGVWVLNEVPDYATELAKCMQYDPISGAYIGMSGLTPPRNLLDNSDFTNLVNQRGKTSATGYTYLFDRWKASENTVSANMSSIGITTDSYLIQYIPLNRFTYGKAYTAALYYADGSVVAKSGIATQATTGWTNWIDMTGLLVYVGSTAQTTLSFRISAHPDKTIMAAALYEGSYTADTLPAYVPKGYAAELAECQRYYIRISDGSEWLTGEMVRGYGFVVKIPGRMRISPTVGLSTGGVQVYTPQEWKDSTYGYLNVLGTEIDLIFSEPDGAVHGDSYIVRGIVDLNADL